MPLLQFLVDRGLVESRSVARAAILQGGLKINGQITHDLLTLLKTGDVVTFRKQQHTV